MKLADFLAAPRPRWDWQTHDCCRWVDRWVQARGHRSPIEALGLVYDSERSAMRRIAEGGGLAQLWRDGMALVGCMEVDQPQTGDVGIIACATDGPYDEMAAIFTGQRWASLTLNGLSFAPENVIALWRV